MAERILITGGTGFIGSHLVDRWLKQGHEITVLTRSPAAAKQRWPRINAVDGVSGLVGQFDRVLNLAGEGIANKRWSDERKRVLLKSHVGLTESLGRWAESTSQQFRVVLSGSAVGFYGGLQGTQAQQTVAETSPVGTDFGAELCRKWEAAAEPLKARSERTVLLRTGLVLGPDGGLLKRLWLPFQMGVGGKMGNGQQMMSWIHIEDYCEAVDHLVKSAIQGAVNMTAPHPVTNQEFTRELAAVLHRPAFLPLPASALRLLFGEMSELLLNGQCALPTVLQSNGFSFRFRHLSPALQNIVALKKAN